MKKLINLLLSFIFLISLNIFGQIVTDVDGNKYNTVKIGKQTWMKENLKTTKFNDGTGIPILTNNRKWIKLRTPSYCYYDNNAAKYKSTYGALYNWYAVNTYKLCPEGWHVPSDAEWQVLVYYLGGDDIAGGKMKEAGTKHWESPNEATNESGFSALPGGYRFSYGDFGNQGYNEIWWSSAEYDSGGAWYRGLGCSESVVYRGYGYKEYGFSVRCLRD